MTDGTPYPGSPPDSVTPGYPPRWLLWEAFAAAGVIIALSALDKLFILPEVREAVQLGQPLMRLAFVLVFHGLPILVLWALWRRKRVGFAEGFGFQPTEEGGTSSGVVRGAIVIIAANTVYYSLAGALGVEPFGPWEKASEQLVQTFDRGWAAVLFAFIAAAVVAPFTEELIFRSVMQSALLRRYGASVALPVTAAVFGAAHLDPYRFVPLTITGWVLGHLAWTRRSLYPPLVLHALVNATALGLAWLAYALGAKPA